MKKRLVVFAVLALVLSLAMSTAVMAKAEFRLKAGIGLNDRSAQFASLQEFKRIVEERTNGRVVIDLYHSSQLGDDREMMEALQLGVQDITCPSTAPIAGFVNGFKVFDLPFIFPSEEAADYVLDSEVGQGLLKQLEAKGIIGLAYWENGFRMLTNSVRAVKAPEDLNGLKIRTMENPIHLAAFRAMGANPTPMAFGELFSAMQQGVVDGQENPYGTIYLQNFFEVQDHVSDTGHVYSPFVLMLSKKTWDKMPEDIQKVIQEAALETKDHNRRINRQMNNEYRDKLREVMTVTILTPAEKKAFREATMPVYEQFSDDIGRELIDAVNAKLAEWEAK